MELILLSTQLQLKLMHEYFQKLKSHHEDGSAHERKPQLVRHKSFVIYTHWARLAPILQSGLGKAGKSLQRMKGDFPVHPKTFPFLPDLPSDFPEGRSWGLVRSGLWGAVVPFGQSKEDEQGLLCSNKSLKHSGKAQFLQLKPHSKTGHEDWGRIGY